MHSYEYEYRNSKENMYRNTKVACKYMHTVSGLKGMVEPKSHG